MKTEEYIAIIRKHSRQIEPIPTGEKAVLRKLPGVKAVLFDVYGTLFMSAAGAPGWIDPATQAQALRESFAAVGAPEPVNAGAAIRCLNETVEKSHATSKQAGNDFPEVNIIDVWRRTLDTLHERGLITVSADSVDLLALALEFEGRVNPVWPMPGAAQCLTSLASCGMVLGMVSNGQSFTPMLFSALLGGAPDALGISADRQFLSYETGHAKPGLHLYQRAAKALESGGILADQTLCVGNDMLNDVAPAKAVGFHTALFAGDARSLRTRSDDPRVQGITPDLVVLNLVDLVGAVCPSRPEQGK